ncbi:hypothetical protein Tco_0586909 [Tanacetum coccineum]
MPKGMALNFARHAKRYGIELPKGMTLDYRRAWHRLLERHGNGLPEGVPKDTTLNYRKAWPAGWVLLVTPTESTFSLIEAEFKIQTYQRSDQCAATKHVEAPPYDAEGPSQGSMLA